MRPHKFANDNVWITVLFHTFFQMLFLFEQKSVLSILLVKLTWSPPEAAQHSIELAQKTDSSYYVPLLWRLSEHNGSQPDEESKRFPSQLTFKRISRKQISNPISVWQPWKMRRNAEWDQSPSFSFNFFPRLRRTNFYHKIWSSIEYFWWKIPWKFPTNFLPYFPLMQE